MNTQAPEVKEIIARAFPGYTGRRISVEPFSGPMSTPSYWSGGSRDYWAVTPLLNGPVVSIPENGTPFIQAVAPLENLPAGFALVRYLRGPFESVTVYVNQENLAKLLPAPLDLTIEEKMVLRYTSGLKSSYGGVSNYRFVEANKDNGILAEQWETAKASCIAKGLLNKAGAITDSGRNAAKGLPNPSCFWLKEAMQNS